MNYSSLLLQIENQLLSLNKKGLKYINIGALPDFELKSVIDGLGEMISIENGISKGTCKTEKNPQKSQKSMKKVQKRILKLESILNQQI